MVGQEYDMGSLILNYSLSADRKPKKVWRVFMKNKLEREIERECEGRSPGTVTERHNENKRPIA